ncbi:zinc finger protein 692 isoform X2 [Antechinus flavipes]|uniref:zinc finger protein 692 isoform X2 n=1 Tax=Antechinus flavipes TaxID=38775 RepID=UPI0022367AF2|nr:zinc finger protein 692 isoform X2 [Antechinus flavipes]
MAASLGSQRQKRRELDARRSKCRIRLGGHMEQWCLLKKQLGFSLHSQLAKFLLDRYNSPGCVLCAGPEPSPPEGLQYLVFLSHAHSRECSLVPGLRGPGSTDGGLIWECSAGHTFSWDPSSGPAPPGSNPNIQSSVLRNLWTKSGSWQEHEGELRKGKAQVNEHYDGTQESGMPREVALLPETSLPNGEDEDEAEEEVDDEDDNLSDVSPWTYSPSPDCNELGTSSPLPPYLPPLKEEEETTPPLPSSPAADSSETGTPHPEEDRVQPELDKISQRGQGSKTRSRRQQQGPSPMPLDEDIAQISLKRIRKTAKRELLPCDFPGCGKIFSNRQYLNHHKKYQHIHQKSFSCPEPSCGKSFNFKKHLKEHVKLHSDTRDYICEFCARSFRTSSNLIIHRRIHTGEKPLQCEICGFTCRQKASLNWHRRKHEEAAAAFQYPCEFCGKKFEKPDNVIAHCSKSHPTPRPGSSPTKSESHLLLTISSSTSPILESSLSCESQKSPTLDSSSSSQIQRNQKRCKEAK